MKREDWMRMMESVDDVYIRETEPGCGEGRKEAFRSKKGEGLSVVPFRNSV